jgi:hypothetical protein
VHVVEPEAREVVPLDIALANREEAEGEVAEAARDCSRRSAPARVGVAVDERQGARRGVDLPRAERIPVTM